MTFENRRWAHIFAFFFVAATGCTRQVNDHTAIAIQLPSPTEYATLELSNFDPDVVIVNVHGDNMSSIYHSEENRCRDTGCTASLPTRIEIPAVPNGKRLVQLLLVLKHKQNGSLAFRYGHASADLTGGSQSVTIRLAQFGAVSNREASLSGRYYGEAASLSSGNVDVRIVPPVSGQPEMIVYRTAVFAGWFNAFAVEGIVFKHYLIPENRLLFSIGYNGDSISINGLTPPAAASNLKVKLPDRFVREQRDQTVSYLPRRAQDLFLGYFGPGVPATFKTYYPSANVTLPDLFETASGTGAVVLETSQIAGDCSFSNDGNAATPLEACVVGLGEAFPSASPPASTDLFVNYLMLHPELLRRDGEEALGFRGPFVYKNWSGSYHNAIFANPSGTSLVVQWQVLPGLSSGSNPIVGFELLRKDNSYDSGGGGGEENCVRLKGQGYVKVADKPLGSNSHTFSSFPLETPASFAVCPYRTVGGVREYLNGANRGTYYPQGGGGGGPATHLTIQGSGSVGSGACVEYEIRGANSSGQWGEIATDLNVSLSSGSSLIHFTPNCGDTSVASTSFNLGPTYKSKFIYFKGSTVGNFSLNASATGLISAAKPISVIAASNPTKLALLGSSHIVQYDCQRYTLQLQDAGGVPMPSQGPLSSIMVSSTEMGFYSDAKCTGSPMSSIFWSVGSAGDTNKSFYYSTTSTTNPSFSVSSGDFADFNFPITLQTVGTPQNLSFIVQDNVVEVGGCVALDFELRDSSQRLTAFTGSSQELNLNTNSGYGRFHYEESCANWSEITGGYPWPNYQTRLRVWYREKRAGAANVQGTIANINDPNVQTITVHPGPAMYVIFVLPGESLMSGADLFGAAVGASNPDLDSTFQHFVTAYTVDSYFNIVEDSISSCSGIFTSDPNDLDPGSVAFFNGVGQVQLSDTSPGGPYRIEAGGCEGLSLLPSNDYTRF